MPANKMGQQMAEFLRLLAGELENNPTLARKLEVPFKELISDNSAKQKKKAGKAAVPKAFDPFQIYYDKGSVGLHNELDTLDVPVLKAILAHFALDPSRSYTRWRKHERLADHIVERVKIMSNKGQAFS